jgi:hypothetical protein
MRRTKQSGSDGTAWLISTSFCQTPKKEEKNLWRPMKQHSNNDEKNDLHVTVASKEG